MQAQKVISGLARDSRALALDSPVSPGDAHNHIFQGRPPAQTDTRLRLLIGSGRKRLIPVRGELFGPGVTYDPLFEPSPVISNRYLLSAWCASIAASLDSYRHTQNAFSGGNPLPRDHE